MPERKYLKNNKALMLEYDATKNTDIDISEITYGSGKILWWKCSKGHSWQNSVHNRCIKKQTCPYCSGRLPIPGINSFADENSELLCEWDYQKNDKLGIKPTDIKSGSNKKVWWRCEKGHEWEAKVVNRVAGNKCPVCNNHKLLAGYNDLQTTNPELASEWNYDKNTELPSEVFEKGRKTVWWICKKGHEWQAPLYTRATGVGCPVCSAESKTSFPEQAIFYYLSKIYRTENRAKVEGKEIDVYLPDYKIGIEYDGYYYHKNATQRDAKKTLFLKQHGITLFRIIETKNKNGFDGSSTFFCQYITTSYMYLEQTIITLIKEVGKLTSNDSVITVDISNDVIDIQELYKNTEKANGILTKDPRLEHFWDKEKNGKVNIEYVNYGTITKYWWKCPECNRSWKRLPIKMIGKGCPYCNGTIVVKGLNDLETQYPELAKEWDYELNCKAPSEYGFGSNKKVHWICDKGHHYEMSISHRSQGRGCPICSNRKITRYENDLATLRPILAAEWNYDKNGDLMPWNVSIGSKKRVWWKCSVCNNEWEAYIYNRSRGDRCPKCSSTEHNEKINRNKIDKKGSLLTNFPDLMEEWDYQKNDELGLDPQKILPGSHKKAWWICKTCGRNWLAVIGNRTKGHGCIVCEHKKNQQ